jgi:hypothetical protein
MIVSRRYSTNHLKQEESMISPIVMISGESIRTFASSIALLCILLTPGCSKDEGTTQPSTGGTIPAEIVGTWTPQTAYLNGSPVLLSSALEWKTGTVRATFSFNAAGAITYTEYSSSNAPLQVTTGTFTVTGTALKIRFLTDNGTTMNPAKDLTIAYSIAGTQLSYTWTDAHGATTLQLTK